MVDIVADPPLPSDGEQLKELREWTLGMLHGWRSHKDLYVRQYNLLCMWGGNPKHPKLKQSMLDLTWSPLPGDPDRRLLQPKCWFPLVAGVDSYLAQNKLWHCYEELRRIRENGINHNFKAGSNQLAIDAEQAVLRLFALAENLDDRLVIAINDVIRELRSRINESRARPIELGKEVGHAASRQSWEAVEQKHYTARELETAIQAYFAQPGRAARFDDLVRQIRRGTKGAKAAAEVLFSRGALERELKPKSPQMISASVTYIEKASLLGIYRGKKAANPTQQNGLGELPIDPRSIRSVSNMDISIISSPEVTEPDIQLASPAEAIRKIGKLVNDGLAKDSADQIIAAMIAEEISPDDAINTAVTLTQNA